MKKVKVCTILAMVLDMIALGILAWIGFMSNSILLWTCLLAASYGFVWDIVNAVKFYKAFKKNN